MRRPGSATGRVVAFLWPEAGTVVPVRVHRPARRVPNLPPHVVGPSPVQTIRAGFGCEDLYSASHSVVLSRVGSRQDFDLVERLR